jgi:hypothetical protein
VWSSGNPEAMGFKVVKSTALPLSASLKMIADEWYVPASSFVAILLKA